MIQANAATQALFVSAKLLDAAALPAPLKRVAQRIGLPGGSDAITARVVGGYASEFILAAPGVRLPVRRGPATRYLAVIDVPEPALMRLPAMLELRRPDYRLHVTRDLGAVRRLLVSSLRPEPRLGVIDAYLLGDSLVVLTGDFEIRSFPIHRVPELAQLASAERGTFDIDPDGSYIHWPARDLHVGVSQLLQAADPGYLVDIEIERNTNDWSGRALRTLREARGLRQIDIPGLSERQVRRIEEGLSRLRPASARSFADGFGMTVSELLAAVARRATELRGRA